MLLTNKQVSKLRKAVSNGSSADVKSSKTQLHKIRQSGGLLGRLLRPLLKTGLPLMKNVLKPFAKSVLIPLRLAAAASATDAAIHDKMFGVSTTALVFSNKDLNVIMKIIKSPEEYSLLTNGEFPGML